MRIDLNHGTQAASESSAPSTQSAAAARNVASSIVSAGEDQAQLSGAHVQALAAQASQLPEVRQERVSALRQAFLSGQYHTNSETVAGAVFDHMLASAAA